MAESRAGGGAFALPVLRAVVVNRATVDLDSRLRASGERCSGASDAD